MSKRWTLKDDQYLSEHEDIDPNFLASHDLRFKGKDAGAKRVAKLKELGVWDKLIAHKRARIEMSCTWALVFGPEWAKDMAIMELEDLPAAISKATAEGETA